jgi:hypothetical protein
MALTTAPLRLVKTPERRRRTSVLRSIVFALLGISVPLLAGCGPDGVIGDSALAKARNGNGNNAATINLSPLKLAFSASQGGSNPSGQAVAISNSGTGKLSWSVGTDAAWLSIFPASGTGAGSITATAIIPGLATGTYSATITVTATGATNTPQSIPVSLTVSAATSSPTTSTSSISLSPTSLVFSATQGGSNPSEQAVAISNSGADPLSWSVSSDVAWLFVFPTSETSPSSFAAKANISGLATGTYSATISVMATGATNTPQSIPVSLTISASQPTTTSASLTWEPYSDPTVVGFFVHYGTRSPNSPGSCVYDQGTYVPLSSLTTSSPIATISNLATGTTFYFTVSAYNGKIESLCSNEVVKAT